jgi:hypothetical protein
MAKRDNTGILLAVGMLAVGLAVITVLKLVVG